MKTITKTPDTTVFLDRPPEGSIAVDASELVVGGKYLVRFGPIVGRQNWEDATFEGSSMKSMRGKVEKKMHYTFRLAPIATPFGVMPASYGTSTMDCVRLMAG